MLTVAAGAAGAAGAAEIDEGSPFQRWHWFKSLRAPEASPFAGLSCCDLADGYPVEAESRADGFWYARLIESMDRRLPPPWAGKWIKVPMAIVLSESSAKEWGYLFIFKDELRCFVPPLRGM